MDRVLVFWSWNGKLTQQGLAEQIDAFQKAGIGGFFMHARAGLEVGYLSEEWFSLVRFAAEYAYERGLDAYLYDENGWPSGYGGGRVPALGKQFCQSWLTPFHGTDEELAAAGGERVADGFARFYNKYYSNLMAPSAVQAFIDCTHEQYRLHLGDLFGKQIKGIFTDEPQLSNFGYPDSPALFEEFERTYGYRLQDRLNDLIVDDKDKSKGEQTRYDYRKLVAKLYRGYTQKIGAWCRRNRLIFTGHMAAEDGLYAQLQTQGDVMPCYLDFGMPGIDSLGKKYPTITLVKQVASVAEQSGKRDVLSETFGTSGHAARPSDWLRIWFFEAMYGVDVACMHLSAYSSVGRRKRDYPPDFSPHLNYFQHLTSLTSPLRKLSEFAAFGKRKADILVINPIGAFWAGYSNRRKSLPAHGATYLDKLFEEGVEEDLSEITVNYRMLQELLLELGFDYHIGDENVMRELKAHCKNGVLTVGEYDYHTVILPFGCRVEEDTGGLLEAFARGGGKLLFTQKVPTYSEGRREERFERLFSEGLLLPLSLRRDLAAKQTACYHLAPEFTLYGRDGFERLKDVYCTVREQDGNKRIFVRNEGQEDRFATFSLKGVWYAVFLQKGESIVISAELDGDVSVYRPFTDRTERAERSIPPFDYFTRQTGFSLAPRAENILVIDSCKASIGGEVYAGDALFVDRAVHEKIDGGNAESAEVTIVYTFINKGYKGKVKLAMETGEECVLCACNGERLSADGGWFYDRDCKTFPVPILREGENTVELKYRISRSAKKLEQGAFETESNLYFYKTEFENIYLLGDFAVRGERSVFRNKERAYIRLQGEYISPHDTIDKIDKIDKIDTETMPFYRGQLSYRGRFFMQDTKGYERLFLRVKTNAPLYAVSVNGSPKSWVTDGYVEIGEHIRDGENLLEIETYSSERNVMGSFHYFDGDNEYVAPETFAGERGWADNFNRKTPFPLIPERTYTDGKLLLPQGVEDVVELLGYKRK